MGANIISLIAAFMRYPALKGSPMQKHIWRQTPVPGAKACRWPHTTQDKQEPVPGAGRVDTV
jgi:hypothetical protein